MNYIKHLNGVFQQFAKDGHLNPTHISLYMALFQFWNINRFPETFFINREEIMRLAKVGSKATYHRCLKLLDSRKYIHYMPSHNPYKGSQIKMLIFDTTHKQDVNKDKTGDEQALVSNTNNTKTILKRNKPRLPKTEIEVIDFFKTMGWPAVEGLKFYNHYQAIGWKLGGKSKIVDWQATANNWMLKAKKLETDTAVSQIKDNLRTSKIKDYDQPL